MPPGYCLYYIDSLSFPPKARESDTTPEFERIAWQWDGALSQPSSRSVLITVPLPNHYITKTGDIWDAQIRQARPGGVGITLDVGS